MNAPPEPVKFVVDAVAATGTGAVIMGWVPEATIILSLIWVCLRIWETVINIRKRDRSGNGP